MKKILSEGTPDRRCGYRVQLSKAPIYRGFLLSMENPQLGWGFRKAFSFKPVIKTPFDLLKHLA
ncbi:hypothetical protein, partial [Salmonella enterica]|uniref:hypothetical protein n=1 Tax=Salmonella enterica TaxID=28901 RepID=UPI001C934945